MSSTKSNGSPRQDTVWWYGGLMEIKTRAEDTSGALGVLEGRFPYKGYGPALHVHSREDEAIYVLEGQIRFRVGDDELVAGPGAWVWQPRGVPQAFSRRVRQRARIDHFHARRPRAHVRGRRRAGRRVSRTAAPATARAGDHGSARSAVRLRVRRTAARVTARRNNNAATGAERPRSR
jgi:hypothetical protein